MPKIEEQYIKSCKPNITVDDPYASSCTKHVPEKFPDPELLSRLEYMENLEYLKAKSQAIADIKREFIQPSTSSGDEDEKKYEGYLVGWLLQKEIGWETSRLFDRPSAKIINDALRFFIEPSYCNLRRTKTKKRYWQIRLMLILIEDVKTDKFEALYNHTFWGGNNLRRSNREFFELGKIDFTQSRKKVIFDILMKLKDKAETYGDPALLSEIYFKLGILKNEKAQYGGVDGSKAYFKKAAEESQKILKDIRGYRRRYINNRVENVIIKTTRYTITNYYQVQEEYRTLSNAHKMVAQTTLLMPRNEEIPISELKEVLEHARKAEEYLLQHPKRREYRNREAIDYPKGSIYKYFGDIYSVLDLERLRADIYSRMSLLLKDPCRAESDRYITEANKILNKIIAWENDFTKDRKDCVFDKFLVKNYRRRVYKQELEKCQKEEWKLHPLLEEKPGIALFSEWGANIIGSAYLAKARLLMSIYPPPNDPKAYLRKAKDLLIEAKKYLVREDDYNFKSAWAEYLVRMNIEASPKELLPDILKAKDILEKTPEGFIFARLWLARIYIKEEKFKEAEKFLKGIFDPDNPKDPSNPYQPVLIPQLKSSIYQMYAELALEDENILKAEELFTKSICWYRYNFYTQIGLADLANWGGRYAEAQDRYQDVLKDSRIPINVRKRIKLGLAETYLRKISLNPGKDPTAEAVTVIMLSLKILEESDELFMIERALESLSEALIAKKKAGEKGLKDLRDNLLDKHFDIQKYLDNLDIKKYISEKDLEKVRKYLADRNLKPYLDEFSDLKKYVDNIEAYLSNETKLADPELRDRVKASLYLKVADGFLFIHEYKQADKIVGKFENWLTVKRFEGDFSEEEFEKWLSRKVEIKKLFIKKPVLMIHYLLTSAEIAQRENQYDEKAIKMIEMAAKKNFSPKLRKEKKIDPFLSARVIKDLIDIYVNKDDFATALAFLFTARGLNAGTELGKLSGSVLKRDKFEPALQIVSDILQGAQVEKIFRNKGLIIEKLYDRWDLFITELQLKQAEIFTWTRNYEPALKTLNKLISFLLNTELKMVHDALKRKPSDNKLRAQLDKLYTVLSRFSSGPPETEFEYLDIKETLDSISSDTLKGLYKARIQLAYGNIAAQWRKTLDRDEDFKKAYAHYFETKDIMKNLTDPNPGQEQILVKAELYINIANIYRYGRSKKDLDEALLFYKLGEEFAWQIKGNNDLMFYHLARIYLGRAKVAEERGRIIAKEEGFVLLDGKEYWPSELMLLAKGYKDEIRRDKYAVRLLTGELQIDHQNLVRDLLHPILTQDSVFFTGPLRDPLGSNELGLRLKLTEPILFHPTPDSNLELDLVAKIHTDMDLNSGFSLLSGYLGAGLKPLYWLTTEAMFRVGTTPIQKKDYFSLKYLNTPDITMALDLRAPGDTLFLRGLSSTVVGDFYLPRKIDGKSISYKNLNSCYANLFYSFGRDFTNPFVQGLSLGVQGNYFRFPYEGNFPKRFRVSPSLKYALDLKEFNIADHDWWFFGMMKAGIEASLIYESATDFSKDGKKSFLKDNLGFSVGGHLTFNLFHLKVSLSAHYERIYQDIQGYYVLKDRMLDILQVNLGIGRTF